MWARIMRQTKYTLKKNLAEMTDSSEYSIDKLEENECSDFAGDKTLNAQLRELRRIFSSVYLSYTEVHKFMSPTFVIWWSTVTVSVTIKHVILVKCIQYHITFGLPFIIRTLKCYVDLTTTTIFFQLVEKFANVVS